MQSNTNELFDLTKYPLEADNVFPYFEVKQKGQDYLVYEGAIGKDRFLFYKVAGDSEAGRLCADYVDQISIIDSQESGERNIRQLYESFKIFIQACEVEALEYQDGSAAWLRYWNDCCQENKPFVHFGIIHHVDALKEWYILKLKDTLEKQEIEANRRLTEVERTALQKRFKNETADEVKQFVLSGANDQSKFRRITISHASELIAFYEWVQQQDVTNDKIDYSLLYPSDLKDGKLYLLTDNSIDRVTFRNYEETINKFGHVSIFSAHRDKYYKIFNVELAALLSFSAVVLTEIGGESEKKFNTAQLRNSYSDGFFEGETYFDKLFPRSYILSNPDDFIFNLHCHYHHIHHVERGLYITWQEGFTTGPKSIDKKSFGNAGYFSGIKASIEDLFKDYPNLNNKFKKVRCDNCEKSNESAKNDLKIDVITTFAEAAVNETLLNNMYNILLSKKVIDNQYALIGTATMLYSLLTDCLT